MTIKNKISVCIAYRQLNTDVVIDDPIGQAIREKMRRQIQELSMTTEIAAISVLGSQRVENKKSA